jgi:hypothetical protein
MAGHLLDCEGAPRSTKRFQTRLRAAQLRHGQATIEDVDYRTPRRLDKAPFQQLIAGKWLTEHRNLLVTGPCGVGKSWPAGGFLFGGSIASQRQAYPNRGTTNTSTNFAKDSVRHQSMLQ